jgi:cbb3-type cytochrome oxidase subunit 3
MTLSRVLVATLMTVATPALALACAVCGTSGIENNSWAYFAMTMVLSGLPLGMIGGVVYWVYRQAAKAEQQAAAAAGRHPRSRS